MTAPKPTRDDVDMARSFALSQGSRTIFPEALEHDVAELIASVRAGERERMHLVRPVSARVNAYRVIRRAIEEGARYGWSRAHKHTDTPDEERAAEIITDAVMDSLAEVLKWE